MCGCLLLFEEKKEFFCLKSNKHPHKHPSQNSIIYNTFCSLAGDCVVKNTILVAINRPMNVRCNTGEWISPIHSDGSRDGTSCMTEAWLFGVSLLKLCHRGTDEVYRPPISHRYQPNRKVGFYSACPCCHVVKGITNAQKSHVVSSRSMFGCSAIE